MFEAYDDNEIQGISPSLIRDYLQGAGWVFHEPYGPYASIYRGPSGKEALVPSLQDSEFYPKRVRELLATVVAADNLSEPALFNDLRYHGRDVTRLVVPIEPDRDTLPPSVFNRLTTGARQVWEDAVKVVGLNASEEADYWETAGFGHTEAGSFVFTMCSPIVSTLAGQLGLMPEGQAQSSARKVTDQMETSVGEVRSALTELKQGTDDAFGRAAERGITPAACEGISKTAEHFDVVHWEIGETGGPGHPLKTRLTASFDRSDAPLLTEAAEAIKRESWVTEPQKAELFGYINIFKKPQYKAEAEATMKTLIRGSQGEQTVHIMLKPDQYETAWRLHTADQDAAVNGKLVRTGAKTWELYADEIGRATMQSEQGNAGL